MQLRLKQFALAKAEIDTLLFLEPYKKRQYHRLFNYYSSTGAFADAVNAADRALGVFSDDKDLLVDKMMGLYYTKRIPLADSLAREIIRRDSTLAYPYLIRGLIMQHSGNSRGAIRNFEKFIELLPEAPETPEVRKRLNELVLQTQKQKQ